MTGDKKMTKRDNQIYRQLFHDNFYFCDECLRPALYDSKEDMVKCKNCGYSNYIRSGFTSDELATPIWKIGCEMEGAANEHPKGVASKRVNFHTDGSVHFTRSEGEDEYCGNCNCEDYEENDECSHCTQCCGCSSYNIIGEWVTRPVAYTRNLTRFANIVEENYPIGVNESCGGHFHLSFKNQLIYNLATDENLWIGLKSHLRHWAKTGLNDRGREKLLNRIYGVNYCRDEFTPETQMVATGTRYTHLNYCLRKHGTIECRILPMFTSSKTYLSALKETVHYIEDWLKQQMVLSMPKAEIVNRDMKGQILPTKIYEYKKGAVLKKLIKPMTLREFSVLEI